MDPIGGARLPNREPHLRTAGNVARVLPREAPPQVLDQTIESPPVLFLAVGHPPHAVGAFGVAAVLGGDAGPAVFGDPFVDEMAALKQQIEKVLGLATVGRYPGGTNPLGRVS
ncbi:hypothetical protein [Mycobacterium sp. Lab-001]|uniref:hypothetical protein n=1 Tax=Mycobacterium sp. Lab-001 TaxID=3410136 RepID=UPI003D1679B1